MSDQSQLEEYRQGLRMAHPPDPVKLEQECEYLSGLDQQGFAARTGGYLKLVGPGYLQSAMTLGGGTAAASLFAGAVFGYQLLWVAPVAMLFGIIMLSAISHQTLSTGMRPFQAMCEFAGAPLAYAWAIGALLSSIIWHFPQYSLASAVLVDMGKVVGIEGLNPSAMGFVVLFWAIAVSMMYGRSPAMIRWYERLLKYMVWGIVVCFGVVVAKTGITDWGALARGFFAFEIPDDRQGIAALTVIVSGLAAAVGVNMVFLYPYSLLARGWRREHRRLARFDLFTGMFLPYMLATSLMVIAMANTLHLDDSLEIGKRLSPVVAAQSLAGVVGDTYGRIIFNFGVLAMAISSITLQMLCCGFVANELFGWRVGSLKYRLATFFPIPGVLGPVFWSDIAVWLAVPTNVICGLFLPAAYLGFIIMQRSRRYLGDDLPGGGKGMAWLFGMIASTIILVIFLVSYVWREIPGFIEEFTGG